jgi:hypothetical protein
MTTKRDHVWWHELNCWDADAARAFYGRALGWTFEPVPLAGGETYFIARRNGRAVCGIHELRPEAHAGIPAHWMTYLAVEDLKAALDATLRAGGQVTRAPVSIRGVGKLAVVVDATDALIGLIEPDALHPFQASARNKGLPQGHALQA